MNTDEMPIASELPIACCLSETDLAQRRDDLSGTIFAHVQQVRELTDGYALRFPGTDDWANNLIAFINSERACCPFFTFSLIFEPDHGPIWLHIRGPDGTKEFIEQSTNFLKGATK